jgi:hypothetical protein
MLIEKVTVTTTATALSTLIATARTVEAVVPAVQPKCTSVKLKCALDETGIVSVKESGSANAVVVLDAANGLYAATLDHFSLADLLFSCNTGTVVMDIMVNQPRA